MSIRKGRAPMRRIRSTMRRTYTGRTYAVLPSSPKWIFTATRCLRPIFSSSPAFESSNSSFVRIFCFVLLRMSANQTCAGTFSVRSSVMRPP